MPNVREMIKKIEGKGPPPPPPPAPSKQITRKGYDAAKALLELQVEPTSPYESMDTVLSRGGFSANTVVAARNGYLRMTDAMARQYLTFDDARTKGTASTGPTATDAKRAGYNTLKQVAQPAAPPQFAPRYGTLQGMHDRMQQQQQQQQQQQVVPQPVVNQQPASAPSRHRPIEMLKANPVPIQPSQRNADNASIDFKVADAASLWARFGVTIGQRLFRRGELLDTKVIKKRYEAKSKGWDIAVPRLSGASGPKLAPPSMEWITDTLIWVCLQGANGPEIYTNVGKVHRFHHSSFHGGGDVIGAGEWIVRQGELIGVNGNSGHYRPPTSALQVAMRAMAPAVTRRTVVLLYDRWSRAYVEVRAMDFLVYGTHQGRYKSHVDADGHSG